MAKDLPGLSGQVWGEAAEPTLVMIDTVISRPLKTALSAGVANAGASVRVLSLDEGCRGAWYVIAALGNEKSSHSSSGGTRDT